MNVSKRPYFSVFENVKEKFNTPMKHIRSFMEPDGQNYESQMPEGYRLHGNSAASFSASMTQNSIELNQWHEMESTVHSQFGTVDNPVLIFTSDSSWRIVICMGPGIEDDAHSHEKMFYMCREGPINRCQVCGQCFKIVRLKDEFSELQDYYTMMFSTLSHFDVSEEDMAINLTSFFGDRPQANMQTIAATNVYVHVNSDEADRILVDPAYKLERTKEAHEKLHAMHLAYKTVDDQLASQRVELPVPYGRDNYETWVQIEKAIRTFDRQFNRIEKFDARKFSDPDSHERRENRMLDGKRERWTDNYTFFFGGLTEEEQSYRDYFKTDYENDSDNEYLDGMIDNLEIANEGQMNPARYDFIETSHRNEVHETYEDLIEDKIFKYKYRQNADSPQIFQNRSRRVQARFWERAQTRDATIEADIMDIYARDNIDASVAQIALDVSDYKTTALDETNVHREYMVREAVQQYRDYYESDTEEHGFFEYLDNLTNRDRIRFMEIGEDFSLSKDPTTMMQPNGEMKEYGMIPKREFNPELSAFSNLALDLQDFRDRVRPQARDMALFDASRAYQRAPANLENIAKNQEDGEFRRYLTEKDDQTDDDRKMLRMMEVNAKLPLEDKQRAFADMMGKMEGQTVDNIMANLVENFEDAAHQTVEEGYSSLEIQAETDSEQVHAAEAEPVIEEAVEEVHAAEAEPVIEEAVEEAAEEVAEEATPEDEEKK